MQLATWKFHGGLSASQGESEFYEIGRPARNCGLTETQPVSPWLTING